MIVTDYGKPLREQDVAPDPLEQFARWFADAERAPQVRMPEAAALATASPDAAPSVRMVLVKGFGDDGFRFFSNYDSQKGRELAANPRAALLFHWDALGRQVRIAGPVQRASEQETAEYVRSRPRKSQLERAGVAAERGRRGPPGARVARRRAGAALRRRRAAAAGELGRLSPRPESFEFWQQRHDRLHDRLRYRRGDGARWLVERLAP